MARWKHDDHTKVYFINQSIASLSGSFCGQGVFQVFQKLPACPFFDKGLQSGAEKYDMDPETADV